MSTTSLNLQNHENANNEYLSGLELLQTSCIKCRCNPSYLDAIPYFKKASELYHGCGLFDKEVLARQKLVKCFNNEKSFWEEGNEYEKISKLQLIQLNKVEEAHNSIINSFHAYASNRTYEDGIKALSKSSNDFVDTNHKNEAIKILEFAFIGIDKYYHILTLNKEDSHHYIYECLDKYIDLLFGEEDYEKSAEICHKISKLIEKEQKDEKTLICKYYGFQAISELLNNKEQNYKKAIEEGQKYEINDNNFCSKIERLVNVVNQRSPENEKLIKSLFGEISRRVPASMVKFINQRFIQINSVKSNDSNEIKTDLSEEEDLK